jgi:hypothetical protein
MIKIDRFDFESLFFAPSRGVKALQCTKMKPSYKIKSALKSLTFVNVGPVVTRSPKRSKKSNEL